MNLAKKIVHPVIRAWLRCTAYFFFEKVIVTGKQNIPEDGPVILASNHPNSFLDGLLLTCYYKRPIYYLARGDVFSSPFVSALLHAINIVPIYRREEGAEHFPKNEETFEFCIETFEDNGTILIFSEGQSENEWDLRPLRKGTARLSYSAWSNEGISSSLKILPTTITYSSWLKINDVVHLSFLDVIQKKDFPEGVEQAVLLRKFNETLKTKLENDCVILGKKENQKVQQTIAGFLLKNFPNGKEMAIKALSNYNNGNSDEKGKHIDFAHYLKANDIRYFKRANLPLFMVSIAVYDLAFLLNIIPFSICEYITKRTTNYNEFYDSVLFCMLLFLYPTYLLAILFIAYFGAHSILLGVSIIALILITAKLREWAKKNMQGYIKRKYFKPLSAMIDELFGKGSD